MVAWIVEWMDLSAIKKKKSSGNNALTPLFFKRGKRSQRFRISRNQNQDEKNWHSFTLVFVWLILESWFGQKWITCCLLYKCRSYVSAHSKSENNCQIAVLCDVWLDFWPSENEIWWTISIRNGGDKKRTSLPTFYTRLSKKK